MSQSQGVSCSASWPIRFRHSSVLLHALPVVLTCSHFLAVSPPSPRVSSQGVSCSASWPIRFRHSSVIVQALPVVLTCSHFLAVSLPSPRSHRSGELLGLVANLVSPLVGPCSCAARRADLLSFPRGVASLASFSSAVCELLGLVPNSVSPLVGPSPCAARRADLLSFPRGVAALASFSIQRVSCSASCPFGFAPSWPFNALPVVIGSSQLTLVAGEFN